MNKAKMIVVVVALWAIACEAHLRVESKPPIPDSVTDSGGDDWSTHNFTDDFGVMEAICQARCKGRREYVSRWQVDNTSSGLKLTVCECAADL